MGSFSIQYNLIEPIRWARSDVVERGGGSLRPQAETRDEGKAVGQVGFEFANKAFKRFSLVITQSSLNKMPPT